MKTTIITIAAILIFLAFVKMGSARTYLPSSLEWVESIGLGEAPRRDFGDVNKFYDHNNGVVCYVLGRGSAGGGISCVK